MTDLNALAVGSPLYLIAAADINSRGEIVGTGFDQNTGEPLAFAAVPCDETGCQTIEQDASPMMQIASEQAKIILPKNIREMLEQRRGLRGLRLGR